MKRLEKTSTCRRTDDQVKADTSDNGCPNNLAGLFVLEVVIDLDENPVEKVETRAHFGLPGFQVKSRMIVTVTHLISL